MSVILQTRLITAMSKNAKLKLEFIKVDNKIIISRCDWIIMLNI